VDQLIIALVIAVLLTALAALCFAAPHGEPTRERS